MYYKERRRAIIKAEQGDLDDIQGDDALEQAKKYVDHDHGVIVGNKDVDNPENIDEEQAVADAITEEKK
ncbi:hypothetical protein K492DRAFT_174834 [Lichtheimia hyalospora FSU 10163]|nr:hypothetical protein K492DRAFT_174834 [Lichtheimia hyalospora FSU 10163]